MIQGTASESDPRNINIAGKINYQIIPSPKLLTVTELTVPVAATWHPIENYRILLDNYDRTGVANVYTRPNFIRLT